MGINFNAGKDMNITVHGNQSISNSTVTEQVKEEFSRMGIQEDLQQEIIARLESIEQATNKEPEKSKLVEFLEENLPKTAGKVLKFIVKAGLLL